MNIKIDIITSLLYARYQGGNNLDDFFTYANKFMQEKESGIHAVLVQNSILLCTPETVVNMIKSDANVLKVAVEQLLASKKLIGAGQLFVDNTQERYLYDDLYNMKLRHVLVSVIKSDESAGELRELSIKLLLRMGLVSASAEDLLRAALYQ